MVCPFGTFTCRICDRLVDERAVNRVSRLPRHNEHRYAGVRKSALLRIDGHRDDSVRCNAWSHFQNNAGWLSFNVWRYYNRYR